MRVVENRVKPPAVSPLRSPSQSPARFPLRDPSPRPVQSPFQEPFQPKGLAPSPEEPDGIGSIVQSMASWSPSQRFTLRILPDSQLNTLAQEELMQYHKALKALVDKHGWTSTIRDGLKRVGKCIVWRGSQ